MRASVCTRGRAQQLRVLCQPVELVQRLCSQRKLDDALVGLAATELLNVTLQWIKPAHVQRRRQSNQYGLWCASHDFL